jgi:DNA polymerase-3 subunit beta
MNFVVQSKALLQQLQIVGGVIAGNSTLPILSDFLFEIKNGVLTITGSDLETTISASMNVNANENGSVAIGAKMLIDALKTFPDQPLTFSIQADQNAVSVTSETGRFKIAGHDPSEFPKIPEVEPTAQIEIDSSILSNAIHKTIFATGNDDLRPVMSGVLLEIGGDCTNFVATDAHKLVKYSRFDLKSDTVQSIIVPKKPLNVLKNILLSFDTPVKVQFNTMNIVFSFDNITVTSRLIDGKYPNYEAVIPKENPNQLTVDRTSFLNTLRRVSLFSSKTTYQIRLRIAGNELHISAEDLDFSNEAAEVLPCSYIGEDMEIGFNSKFFMEMLSNMDGCDTVTLKMSVPNRAGILVPAEKADENEDIMMLVMPILLNN